MEINTLKQWLTRIAAFVLGYLLCYALTRRCAPPRDAPPVVDTVTVTRTGTVTVTHPVSVREEIVRYVRVPITMHDTVHVTEHDTTTTVPDSLTLPITQRVYQDSSYTAFVSGYRPALDSIRLHRPTHYIYIRSEAAPARRRRWSVGVQAGYGLTPRGLQPYIGLGASFHLW